MPVFVSKFGGTSLSTGERFLNARDIVSSDPNRRFVVVSAPGKRFKSDEKITDLLMECAESQKRAAFEEIRWRFLRIAAVAGVFIQDQLDACEAEIFSLSSKAHAASRGEFLSAKIFAKLSGFSFLDAKDAVFFRDGRIDEEKTMRAIKKAFQREGKIVMPGFYGADEKGNIVLFPRGGSDTSGAIAACAIRADAYENWTDVDGVFDKDPNFHSDAKSLAFLTYDETERILEKGAAVLHPEALYWARKSKIPIHVRNTFHPHLSGTIIGEG